MAGLHGPGQGTRSERVMCNGVSGWRQCCAATNTRSYHALGSGVERWAANAMEEPSG